jgi:hypothetical protein
MNAHSDAKGGVPPPTRRPGRDIGVWVFCFAALIGGCAVSPETVNVPVAVRAKAPAELTAAIASPLPVFVAPTDAAASSALTPEGERALRAWIDELLTRLRAWQAWATAP